MASTAAQHDRHSADLNVLALLNTPVEMVTDVHSELLNKYSISAE